MSAAFMGTFEIIYDMQRTVCGFRFDGLPIGGDELTGHHAKTAESLGEDVRLDIAIVVLARPNEPARRLDGLRNHVIDETVLVVN